MDAHYAFSVRIRIEPAHDDVTLEEPIVERRCLLRAPEPGTDGWLFFRDVCWRGEVSDQTYARDLFAEKLGLPVESVAFRALHTDEEYLDALKSEIADSLDAFNAEAVTEVISKYLGSSLEVHETKDE